MKKESFEIEEKSIYELDVLLNNTALMKSAVGKTGLINIKTNEIVGSFDNFYTLYSSDDNLYYQEKNVEDEINDSNKSYSKKNLHVRIYDALDEKTIAEDWIVISRVGSYYSPAILFDPKTKKYHLFDGKKYRTTKNVCDTEFDEIKFLYDFCGEKFLSLCKDGKKAIYSSKKGLLTFYQYDDIQRIGSTTVFTKDNYKFFTCLKDCDGNDFTSPLFKDIKGDNRNLIYCKSDSTVSIYYVEKMFCRLLFTAPLCDDIECVSEVPDSGYRLSLEYIFLINKNKKYGVLSGVVDRVYNKAISCSFLTLMKYDGIKYDNGKFFLKCGKKMGLFVGDSRKNNIIHANFDKIVPIDGTDYYELFNGERCDIYNISSSNVVVQDCKIIKNIGNIVIYEQNGKKGIFTIKDKQVFLLKWYDDIQYLGSEYFLVTQNGKKGIIYGTQILFKPIYESIQVNGFHNYRNLNVLEYADSLYFSLKKTDGSYNLAKYMKGKNSWYEKKLEYLNVFGCNDIQLYNSIIVFRNNKNTYIYSYTEKLLKTYPADVEIREETLKINNKEIDLYAVDGVYYLYKNEKFEVAPIEECILYATAYESECGTVVVNSYDKKKHDEMCKMIEGCSDEEFDDTLMKIYKKNPQIQKKFKDQIIKKED